MQTIGENILNLDIKQKAHIQIKQKNPKINN